MRKGVGVKFGKLKSKRKSIFERYNLQLPIGKVKYTILYHRTFSTPSVHIGKWY